MSQKQDRRSVMKGLSASLRRTLQQTPYDQRQEKAVDLLARVTGKVNLIPYLDEETCLDLAASLMVRHDPDQRIIQFHTEVPAHVREAWAALMPHLGPIEAYRQREALQLEATAERLLTETDLMQQGKLWSFMDDIEKNKLLQHHADHFCRHMGRRPVRIIIDALYDTGVLGYYDNRYQNILINNSSTGALRDFRPALETLYHELGHHLQRELVQQVLVEKKIPDDASYRQAWIFAINRGRVAHFSATQSHHRYRNQPLERHANETARIMTDQLFLTPLQSLRKTLSQVTSRLKPAGPRF